MLPPGALMASSYELQRNAQSVSMVLHMPGSASIVSVTTACHVDAQSLSHPLSPCWCMRAMLPKGPCCSEWPVLPPEVMVTSEPRLQNWVLSGCVTLLQPESVLMTVAHVVIKGHKDSGDQGYNLCHLGVHRSCCH